MQETVGVVLAPMVVNKCEPAVNTLSAPVTDSMLAEAYAYAQKRHEAQEAAITLLSSLRHEPQLHLLRHREDGGELVSLLSDDLARAFGELP